MTYILRFTEHPKICCLNALVVCVHMMAFLPAEEFIKCLKESKQWQELLRHTHTKRIRSSDTCTEPNLVNFKIRSTAWCNIIHYCSTFDCSLPLTASCNIYSSLWLSLTLSSWLSLCFRVSLWPAPQRAAVALGRTAGQPHHEPEERWRGRTSSCCRPGLR